MHEHKNSHSHVGRAGGGASHPTPDDAPRGNDAESIGSGDIEIPLGVPMSGQEFRRLKEEARQPGRDGAEDTADQAQEDQAQEDEGRDDLV